MKKAEDWRRVKEVFAAVLERSPQSRARLLEKLAADDSELRREVESLLIAHEKSGNFIERPPLKITDGSIPVQTADFDQAERIGAYRLVREVGRGGMGVVYLAMRDGEFQKRVAIKLVKRGLDAKNAAQRFRRERQILAALEHPHIARLLDGGTTDSGLPFLVMEYVEGLPLLEFAEKNNVSIHELLKLFRLICEAVDYAHQNLIVHRDLKPSNILVTAAGVPKLLDFGVSKLLQTDATENAQTETHSALRVFTPEYASPEQINGGRVTTATDVYSLGVVLYELLTGTRPYRFAANDFHEIARVVNQAQTEKPSAIVQSPLSKIEFSTNKTSQQTQADKKRLCKQLKGDLDNIVLKAMHKEPARRYNSVAALDEDIRRHLAGLPVEARVDGLGYRAGKFIKRHKAAFAALCVILALLVAGISATMWQAGIANRARDNAEIARARAERINGFLQKMLASADPNEQGRDTKVIDVLNSAEQQARRELSDRPEVLASVLQTIGNTYKGLAQYKPAENSLRLALTLTEQLNQADLVEIANCQFDLANVLQLQNKSAEAESLLRQSIEVYRRSAPASNRELALALGRLGGALRGRDNQAATRFLHEALTLSEQTAGAESDETLAILHDLALVRSDELDAAGETEIYNRIIPILRQTPASRADLSTVLMNQSTALMDQNRLDEADSFLAESLQMQTEVFGAENINVSASLTFLAKLRLRQNRFSEAQTAAEQALAMQKKLLPINDSMFIGTLSALGEALINQDKAAEGELYLRQALELVKSDDSAEDWVIALHESRLGECLLTQKRFAAAEPLLLDSHRKIAEKLGENHQHTVKARDRVNRFYARTKQKSRI